MIVTSILFLLCTTTSVFSIDLLRLNSEPKITYTGICDSTNCRYGSCEIYSLTEFICHCLAGVTGKECDQLDKTQNPCSSSPCSGGATCVSSGGTFFCACPTGRTGTLCESHVGPCQCQNGGTCSSTGTNSYSCTCTSAYGGNLCQYPLSSINTFCIKEPCKNNGTCITTSSTSGYCMCPTNYKGTYCEIYSPTTSTTTTTTLAPSVTKCPSTATICQNGGTCFILNGTSIICQCPIGFTGTYCDSSIATATTAVTTTVASITACSSTAKICKKFS
jgi:hypothetical protein